MTNLPIPFECPIRGSDGFRQVGVKGGDGSTPVTQAYECRERVAARIGAH
jgi:hypothetical protein